MNWREALAPDPKAILERLEEMARAQVPEKDILTALIMDEETMNDYCFQNFHCSFNSLYSGAKLTGQILLREAQFKRKPSVDPMAYRMKTEGGAGHGHRREPEIQTRWGFKERGVSASGEADGDSARTRNTSAKYFQG